MARLDLARRLCRLTFGICALVIGAATIAWWFYNEFVERQPQYQRGGSIALFFVMVGVGVGWLRAGILGRDDHAAPPHQESSGSDQGLEV